jgi:ABC-type transport system involved in cytochrome bd biosynthesis fused ATPase/permease subunit
VARRSGIRASDADRDSVVERLRTAAAEGRLAAHELETRVTAALRAKTYGELDETVCDLPGLPRERRRSASGHAVAAVRAHPALILVAIPVVLIVVAAMIAIMTLWAAVTVFAVVCCNNRRMMYRGPWTWHQRQIHTSR